MSNRARSYSSSDSKSYILDSIRTQRSNSIANSFGFASSFKENIDLVYRRFFHHQKVSYSSSDFTL